MGSVTAELDARFDDLATKFGPAFADAMVKALIALGLSVDQARKLVETLNQVNIPEVPKPPPGTKPPPDGTTTNDRRPQVWPPPPVGLTGLGGDVEGFARDFFLSIVDALRPLLLELNDFAGLARLVQAEVATLTARAAQLREELKDSGLSAEDATEKYDELRDVLIRAIQAEIDHATELKRKVDELTAAVNAGIDRISALTLAFAATDGQFRDLWASLRAGFNATRNVSFRVHLFAAALNLLGTAAQRFAEGLGGTFAEIRAGFDAVFAQIPGLIGEIRRQFPRNPQEQLNLFGMMADALQSSMQSALAANATYWARQRDLASKASQERVDALTAERDAVQETLAAVQEWASVIDAVKRQLLDLQVGSLAPLNPMTQVGIAQAAFDAALAEFRTGPTAAGAQTIQDLASTLLQAGADVFARPSPEYQALFASVTAGLEEVRDAALAQAGGATLDDLNAQLESIDARIEAEQDALTARLEELTQLEREWTQTIREVFASQFDQLRTAMVKAVLDLAEQQRKAADALQKVIGDKTYEQFIAEKQREQVQLLTLLLNDWRKAMRGFGLKGFEHGTDYVPYTGPALVHRGEAIIPAHLNTAGWRGGSSAGGSTTLVIEKGAIVITGVDDAKKAAKLALEEVEKAVRGGRLRYMIQESVKGLGRWS
jgi:hypothetical protein